MNDVIIYTSSDVEPRRVVQNFGLIGAHAKYAEGAMREKTALARSNECYAICLQGLKEVAAKKGANAVLNFRLTSGPYQASGAAYNTHILYATGDAVYLEGGQDD